MATGRTTTRWMRFYADGFDLSAYGKLITPLKVDWEMADVTAPMGDSVTGFLPDHPSIGPGTFSAVMDSTATSGLLARLGSAWGTPHNLMIPIGVNAAPAMGNPVFAGAFNQLDFVPGVDGTAQIANINFGEWDNLSLINYTNPWGVLLHAKGAEVGANASTGVDMLAGHSLGGYLMYQIFASNAAGTATIKVQHADPPGANGDFGDLAGATTAAIGFGSIPASGIVALGNTVAIKRYLRWQLTLAGGMNTCTFSLAWIPGR